MPKRSYASTNSRLPKRRKTKGKSLYKTGRRPTLTRVPRAVPLYTIADEKKGMDTTIQIVDVPNHALCTAILLNAVDMGTGSYERIGRRIKLDSLRIKMNLSCSLDVQEEPFHDVIYRISVLFDPQPQGVLPTFDTVFRQTNQSGTEASQFTSMLSYDQMDRYEVLGDEVVRLNMESGMTGGVVGKRIMCQ